MKQNLFFIFITILILILLIFPRNLISPKIYIMIDPGHGGADPGTTSVYNTFEKDINLELSLLLKKKLRLKGYKVQLTREDDSYLDLEERVGLANSSGADFLISIHCNAIENKPDINGVQLLYYPDSKDVNSNISSIMMDHIISTTSAADRGCIPRENLVVLKETNIKSILIEAGFLTNEKEALLLEDRKYQNKLIEGISSGMEALIKKDLIYPKKSS